MSSPQPSADPDPPPPAPEAGAGRDAGALLPSVYEELRRLAAARMASERPGQTLQATALVHEAYLKLVGQHRFSDRSHFFRVAAEAMRQILVDRARRRRRARHGGNRERVGLSEVADLGETPGDEILALDEALGRLAEVSPRLARLVELRYFAGLSEREAAEVLGVSRATAGRDWAFARAWLIRSMDGRDDGENLRNR